MPFFQSQLISAQPRHFTELKTRNSTIKLKVIAKGCGLGTPPTSKLLNVGCSSPHAMDERTKAREDRKMKPIKILFNVHCGEFES